MGVGQSRYSAHLDAVHSPSHKFIYSNSAAARNKLVNLTQADIRPCLVFCSAGALAVLAEREESNHCARLRLEQTPWVRSRVLRSRVNTVRLRLRGFEAAGRLKCHCFTLRLSSTRHSSPGREAFAMQLSCLQVEHQADHDCGVQMVGVQSRTSKRLLDSCRRVGSRLATA